MAPTEVATPSRERLLPLATCALLVIGGALTGVLMRRPARFASTDLVIAAALAIAFTLVEVVPLHLEWAGQAYSLSLSEIPLAIGLFYCPNPVLLIVARVLGGGIALAKHRRQPVRKLSFNIGVQFVEVVVAITVFGLLPSHSGAAAGNWTPYVALCASSIATVLAVCLVIWLTVSHLDRSVVWNFIRNCGIGVLANCSAALVLIAAVRQDPTILLPLGAVIAALGGMYHAFTVLNQRHANLELLYDFTSSLDRSTSTERRMRDVLRRTMELLRAEHAELLLISPGNPAGELVRRWIGEDGSLFTEAYTPQTSDWPVARVLANDVAALIPRGVRDDGLSKFLESRGIRDCMIAPLRGDGQVIGAVWVANRRSDIATFTDDDSRMLQTVASQVSSVLDNSRLLDRLRHDSLHDALTGLANRARYQGRLREALARAGTQLAVLLMDLDRFKEVNDTLGHYHGDLLICEIAERLVESAPPGSTVARLGGDEFALLIPDVDADGARHAAELVRTAVGRPCVIEGVSIDVSGSVGIALAPADGINESVLLKCADMAMYAAKDSGTGIEFYDSTRDEYSPRRLALASRLRESILNGELELHYQPQIEAGTREVVCLEALVRWNHPVYGRVLPGEFVPIAEQSGAISELTRWVLTTAVNQLVTWRQDGYRLGVAVNVSMRNLLDSSVPELLADLSISRRLPMGALTLELTESHLMADPERTLPILNRLAEQGVRLSIDDFGTGYSSLAYLKQLPVHEVKIDKSFVSGIRTNASEAAIVRAIVNLAEGLDLDTVAEGVEDAETMQALVALGCTRLQGYEISRPLPATDIRAWLAAWPPIPIQARRAAELHVVRTSA